MENPLPVHQFLTILPAASATATTSKACNAAWLVNCLTLSKGCAWRSLARTFLILSLILPKWATFQYQTPNLHYGKSLQQLRKSPPGARPRHCLPNCVWPRMTARLGRRYPNLRKPDVP